jgi:hypothetical protein
MSRSSAYLLTECLLDRWSERELRALAFYLRIPLGRCRSKPSLVRHLSSNLWIAWDLPDRDRQLVLRSRLLPPPNPD